MKIGILGAGHMGSGIIKGLLRSQEIIPENILVKGGKSQTAITLQKELQFQLTDEYATFENCQLIIIATAATGVLPVLSELKKEVQTKAIPIVSVASGVSIQEMQNIMGEDYPLAHAIPNVSVEINRGIIGIAYPTCLQRIHKQTIEDSLACLGKFVVLPESQLDTLGTLAGCGPAFVDLFIEVLSDAAVMHGLNRQLSYELAAEMIKGAGELALATRKHPAQLKDSVTSPGGTTIKGIVALEKNNFRFAVIDAFNEIMK